MIRRLLFILLAIPSLGLALSCNDLVRLDQPYRYRDLLERFVILDGNSYAQSRSARTGSTALPDGYYAMAPEISQAYRLGGADLGSLLVQVAAGRFGAARPLPATDLALRERLRRYYQSFLGNPNEGRGSLLDAWHHPGTTGFRTMAGAAIAGLPTDLDHYAGSEPAALALAADGTLQIPPERPQAGQIVMLPGVMDCAVTLTTDPAQAADTSTSTVTDWYCGVDRDGDGTILGPGEQTRCTLVDGQPFCPLGQTACLERTTAGGCPEGTRYDASVNRCVQDSQPVCPEGYTLNTQNNLCSATPACPDGMTLVAGSCQAAAIPVCPVGGSVVGNDCLSTPTCPSDTVLSTDHRYCQIPPQFNCPAGTSYDASASACLSAPYCSTGQYLATADACSSPATTVCPSGLSLSTDGRYCQSAPSCPDGYHYQATTDRCERSVTPTSQSGLGCKATSFPCISGAASCCSVNISCPGGSSGPVRIDASYCCLGSASLTLTSASDFLTRRELSSGGYALSAVQCTADGTCTSYFMDRLCFNGYPLTGWIPSGSFSMAVTSTSCPSGSTLQSDGSCLAVTPPSCSQGSFDAASDRCLTLPSYQCASGSYAPSSNSCLTPALCTSGSLDPVRDQCLAPRTPSCPTGLSYSSSRAVCSVDSSCPGGSFDEQTGLCRQPVQLSCTAGSLVDNDCRTNPTCLTGGSLVTTAQTSSCQATVVQHCPAGMLLEGSRCTVASSCPAGYTVDPERGLCSQGLTNCPFGDSSPCLIPPGGTTPVCSANHCFNPNSTSGESETIVSSLPDDQGARASDGSCQGVLSLFSGGGSRCRPPGLQVGMLNDCCDAGTPPGATGTSTGAIVTGVRTAWEIGQVSYYGSAVANGSASIIGVSGSGSAISSVTILTESSTVTIQGAAASGVVGAATSGVSGSAAVSAGLESYTAALANPLALSITGTTLVATRVLYGSGCDAQDLQTALLKASGSCHLVGSYCAKKLPLAGCIQKAYGYCCFNSRLARIIHEQGRSQLPGFNPQAPFGSPTTPDCRGLTPEEFQALDFGTIDLSEYIGTLPSAESLTERMRATTSSVTPSGGLP